MRLAVLATAGLATAFVSKSGPAPAVVRAPAQTAMQMKLYDWKRREAAEDASVGATEFRVDNIKPAPGATKRKMRKAAASPPARARRAASACAARSRARAGPCAGFEGRPDAALPAAAEARGPPDGPGHQSEVFSLIKLEQLAGSSPNSEVDFASLLEAGQVTKKKYDVVKVVGSAATSPCRPASRSRRTPSRARRARRSGAGGSASSSQDDAGARRGVGAAWDGVSDGVAL